MAFLTSVLLAVVGAGLCYLLWKMMQPPSKVTTSPSKKKPQADTCPSTLPPPFSNTKSQAQTKVPKKSKPSKAKSKITGEHTYGHTLAAQDDLDDFQQVQSHAAKRKQRVVDGLLEERRKNSGQVFRAGKVSMVMGGVGAPKRDIRGAGYMCPELLQKLAKFKAMEATGPPSAEVEMRFLLGPVQQGLQELFDDADFAKIGWLLDQLLLLGSVRGGLFITVDGKTFSNEFTVDEMWMTTTWFTALHKLLDGDEEAHAYPYWVDGDEDACLTLIHRNDGILHLQHAGSVRKVVSQVQVSFRPFVEDVLKQARLLGRCMFKLDREITLRQAKAKSGSTAASNLARVKEHIPTHIKESVNRLSESAKKLDGL